MLRCREGDLAEIIRSSCGNEGRRVYVERLVGLNPYAPEDGPCWQVLPLQPLRIRFFARLEDGSNLDLGVDDTGIERSVIADAWLRPIRDPLPPGSDTADDREPLELQHPAWG